MPLDNYTYRVILHTVSIETPFDIVNSPNRQSTKLAVFLYLPPTIYIRKTYASFVVPNIYGKCAILIFLRFLNIIVNVSIVYLYGAVFCYLWYLCLFVKNKNAFFLVFPMLAGSE